MAATQPIINAEAHEVACAVGVVVLCGTLAMFIYPALQAGVAGALRNLSVSEPSPSPSP